MTVPSWHQTQSQLVDKHLCPAFRLYSSRTARARRATSSRSGACAIRRPLARASYRERGVVWIVATAGHGALAVAIAGALTLSPMRLSVLLSRTHGPGV